MFKSTLISNFHNNFNLGNKTTENFTILRISIFLHKKNYITLCFSRPSEESLKWSVMGASTLLDIFYNFNHELCVDR